MVLLNITNIYYINLESRLDRKIHTEEQLKNVNLIGKRFPAIKNDKIYLIDQPYFDYNYFHYIHNYYLY